MNLRSVLVGEGDLAGGVLERFDYDRDGDRIVLSFSTAVSPTQIYTIEGKERDTLVMHTEERTPGHPRGAAIQRRGRLLRFVRRHTHLGPALPASGVARFCRPAPAGLLHPRRAAEPGAPGLLLVLHAADPVPDPARLCRLRAQRARLDRLRPELHQAGGPGLGRPGPPGPRPRHDQGPAEGQAPGRDGAPPSWGAPTAAI